MFIAEMRFLLPRFYLVCIVRLRYYYLFFFCLRLFASFFHKPTGVHPLPSLIGIEASSRRRPVRDIVSSSRSFLLYNSELFLPFSPHKRDG